MHSLSAVFWCMCSVLPIECSIVDVVNHSGIVGWKKLAGAGGRNFPTVMKAIILTPKWAFLGPKFCIVWRKFSDEKINFLRFPDSPKFRGSCPPATKPLVVEIACIAKILILMDHKGAWHCMSGFRTPSDETSGRTLAPVIPLSLSLWYWYSA